MQSDERVVAALAALHPWISLFRLVVSGTLERGRTMLTSESGADQSRARLGEFASGRIDPERFAMISTRSIPLDATGREIVQQIIDVLDGLLTAGDEQFLVDVAPAASPGDAIRARLAGLGTAYAAARRLDLVSRSAYDRGRHGSPSDGHPFEKWSAAERALAPPLVVRLDGASLDVFDLAPLVDGCVRLVLLVHGQATPAPLARLVSPGALVAQVDDGKLLESLTAFNGPSVIAMMQGAEARFVHDPRAGSAPWKRIRVDRMPATPPRRTLGSRSAWQQRDDLAHLQALIEPPTLAPAVVTAGETGFNGHADPAERLTAWLLDQSGQDGVA